MNDSEQSLEHGYIWVALLTFMLGST